MIITIANFKGGVGKTTTAIHLAGALAEKHKTLLIDGDQNQSSLEWSAQGSFKFDVITSKEIKNHFTDYDHIVVDTEARPNKKDFKSLAERSHKIILPTFPDALSITPTVKTYSEIEKIAPGKSYILIAMTPPPPSRDGSEAKDYLQQKKFRVLKSEIKRYVAYKKASLVKKLVRDVKNPYARIAWSDYKNLAKEILRK